MRIKQRLLAGLIGLAAATGLALSGGVAASAASTTGTVTSQYLGGYEASYATTHVNEVRSNVTLPSLNVNSQDAVTADTIASGVALQAGPGGGATLGVAFVWDDSAATSCGTDQWALEYGTAFESSQTPIVPAGGLKPVVIGSPPHNICVSSGTYYVEAHYSTAENQFAVVAAPLEADQTTVALVNHPFGSFGDTTFLEAGVGVDTTNGADAALLPTGTQFGYTRNGLTEPAGYNHGGQAGTRVTLDFFPTTMFEGTTNGGPASDANLATISPTLLPDTSSNFFNNIP